jgi:chromosome segregation ATPase
MTVTTEEAQRLAVRLSLDAEAPQAARYQPYTDHAMRDAAAAIRSLAAERDALQKRVAELEEALDAASRVLHKAGEQFSEYAKQHAAYRTAVSDLKADANKQWAERCFSAYGRAVEGGKDE